MIKLCGLNVCGLSSKIDRVTLKDHIKLFDIFCVSESKSKDGVEIENFTIFNLENRTEDYRLPGIHGLHVYVKNPLADKCIQIPDNNFRCNLVIWIKLAETFILGALYLPYEGSRYYKRGVFDDLTLDICSIKSQYDLPLLLIGDFNSRTGLLNEILMLETHDDLLDPSHFKYPDIISILIH